MQLITTFRYVSKISRTSSKLVLVSFIILSVIIELVKSYNILAHCRGEFRNKGTNSCMDTMGKPAPTKMGVSGCHGLGSNQVRYRKSQARCENPYLFTSFFLFVFFLTKIAF